LKKEVVKQHQLLHLQYPKLGTVLPYELTAVDVLKRMASDAGMTKSQARSWACNAAGLDKDAWNKEMAGLKSLGSRVSQASSHAKRTLQNKR
jgi:hypothetical protein